MTIEMGSIDTKIKLNDEFYYLNYHVSDEIIKVKVIQIRNEDNAVLVQYLDRPDGHKRQLSQNRCKYLLFETIEDAEKRLKEAKDNYKQEYKNKLKDQKYLLRQFFKNWSDYNTPIQQMMMKEAIKEMFDVEVNEPY